MQLTLSLTRIESLHSVSFVHTQAGGEAASPGKERNFEMIAY